MHLPQVLSPTDYIQGSGHVTCLVPVVGKIHEGSSCKSLSFQGELKEVLGFRDKALNESFSWPFAFSYRHRQHQEAKSCRII